MTTIGLALIARDEEENLRVLLPRVKEFFDEIVVAVDSRTSDQTRAVCQENGVRVIEHVWDDGREDFAAARIASFAELSTDWLGWCDADDEWVGLDGVRALIEEIEQKAAGSLTSLWCKYQYDRLESASGQMRTADVWRERFVRRGSSWRWVGRIHEHLEPESQTAGIKVPQVEVIHHRKLDRDPARHARNIRILRSVIHENPADHGAWYQLAAESYLTQDYRRARRYLTAFLKLPGIPDATHYQGLHRLADCYRALGNYDQAKALDWQAVEFNSAYADAWLGLAECFFAAGDFERALEFIAIARGEKFPHPPPPDFLQLNETDYTFLPLIFETRIYLAQGRVAEAHERAAKGLEIFPEHRELAHAYAVTRDILDQQKIAQQALDLASAMALRLEHRQAVTSVAAHKEESALLPKGYVALYQALPDEIRRHPQVREALVVPNLLRGEKADVVIWCGKSVEEWGPESPLKTGIGGSETAVVEVSKRLAARGVNVTVYNTPGAQEGVYLGGRLRYVEHSRFDPTRPHQLLVAWRNPVVGRVQANAKAKWLWLHDLNLGPELTSADTAPFDLVRPVSRWHADYLAALYPFLRSQLLPTRNGLDLARFGSGEEPERAAHHVVWGSSPDRGLIYLLDLWPRVLDAVPDATLDVLYGWESLVKTAQLTGNLDLLAQKSLLEARAARLPGVRFTGRLNQRQVAKAYERAAVLAYPTSFLEVSWITGMEAMAAGCAIVTTDHAGAIRETCGDIPLYTNGHPLSEGYQRGFTEQLVAVLRNAELRDALGERGQLRAQELSWDGVADEWLTHLEQPAKKARGGAKELAEVLA